MTKTCRFIDCVFLFVKFGIVRWLDYYLGFCANFVADFWNVCGFHVCLSPPGTIELAAPGPNCGTRLLESMFVVTSALPATDPTQSLSWQFHTVLLPKDSEIQISICDLVPLAMCLIKLS